MALHGRGVECVGLNYSLRRLIRCLRTLITPQVPVSHAFKFLDQLRAGQSLGIELGGQLNVFRPVLLEIFLVYILNNFMLCYLLKAVVGRSVVYSVY